MPSARRPLDVVLAALLAALALVLASGCATAGAEASAPRTPEPTTGGVRRSDQVHMVAGVQSEATSLSPSEARGSRPQKSRPLSLKKESADRDADGIPDKADAVPADERIAFNGDAPSPPPPPPPPPPGAQPANAPGPTPSKPGPARDGSMIIYTAKMTLAVYQVESALGAVERIAKEQGGFLATRADRSITIRVPRDKFESTLAMIEKTGDVLHRDVQATDVTEEFVDLEIRIKNARAMRERLTKLLEKAPVKEALEIEKELGRVTEELERFEGRLKLLSDKIAYSTITVEYNGRGSSIQPTSIRLPFPWLGALGLPSLLRLHEDR